MVQQNRETHMPPRHIGWKTPPKLAKSQFLLSGTISSIGLPCIPRPQKHWNAIELALLGDTVWEYYVRRHAMFPPSGIRTFRQRLESLSSAESQVLSMRATFRLGLFPADASSRPVLVHKRKRMTNKLDPPP